MYYVPQTIGPIAVGVLRMPARGIWVLTPGTFNFKDGTGEVHSLAAGYLLARMQYQLAITEVMPGTVAKGLLLY